MSEFLLKFGDALADARAQMFSDLCVHGISIRKHRGNGRFFSHGSRVAPARVLSRRPSRCANRRCRRAVVALAGRGAALGGHGSRRDVDKRLLVELLDVPRAPSQKKSCAPEKVPLYEVLHRCALRLQVRSMFTDFAK